ncbi:MAG: SCO family protein [Acidobacteriota bacterium]|nr:MAG: SCO family protein [Acidobacteriota bacterium]
MKIIRNKIVACILIAAAAVLSIHCTSGDSADDEFTAGPNAKRYELKGVVESVNLEEKTAMIAHEEIPGFMEPMTMKFRFKDEWVWDALKEGSQVTAVMVVDNEKGKYWLENPSIVDAPTTAGPEPPKEDVAVEGKKVIDFSLTDQDGNTLTPKDFEGKAWAITFIYTACPLPEYCILMSKNFSDLANQIADDPELSNKVRLLSISFDPAKDTPEKLRAYGLGYLGKESRASDFKIWKLAVGEDEKIRKIADFFGLRYEVDEKNKTHFNHSLRTVAIGPEGTVRKVFSGGDWKKSELLDELKASLK